MQRVSWRRWRPEELDTRRLILLAAAFLLLVLSVSAYLLGELREQRQEARQNRVLLAAWRQEMLTATPAARERERLQQQLLAVRERFSQASGLLPGTDVDVTLMQRIMEAAERSGVELTALTEKGESFQEGSLVGWEFNLSATGSLERLTDFTSRLEQEAFPAAYLTDPLLSDSSDGEYLLDGTLTVYGSTLSTGELVLEETPVPGRVGEALRRDAQLAMERGDYELALSRLLRLRALEPTAPDADRLLYEAYVAYGEALLEVERFDLAGEQFEAALAINPNGQEAVAGLLAIAQSLTTTPSPEAVAVGGTETPGTTELTASPMPDASPTSALPPTAEPPPTRTPRPTDPPDTATPEPTATATTDGDATGTPDADATGTPDGTVTVTTVAGTPSPYPFGAMSPHYLPNCGLTQIKGTIEDSDGNPVDGVTVRVWWDGAEPDQVYSLPSGRDPTRGPGQWDVVLDSYPKPGQWYIAVVNRETGEYLSPVQTVHTDNGPCKPGESGRQVVIQDFVKFGDGPGTPAATLTPSVTPTATAEATNTPTITPTATPTPYSYMKDENPDRDIPDGPGGQIESPLEVPDDVKIRQARIFINIDHNDVGDLVIYLIHPDGTTIKLHDQGEDQGEEEIRRWFAIEDNNLAGIKDKSAKGTWKLDIRDTIQDRIGTLRSWQLEIYP